VKAGTIAPDLEFLQPDGTPVRLSAFLDREFLLVVFLRHLA
jgi:peroxiredoxin